MTYADPNFKTKKELKAAVKAGEKVHTFEPNLGFTKLTPAVPGRQRRVYLEGPHYPAEHRWWATALVDDEDIIVQVVN